MDWWGYVRRQLLPRTGARTKPASVLPSIFQRTQQPEHPVRLTSRPIELSALCGGICVSPLVAWLSGPATNLMADSGKVAYIINHTDPFLHVNVIRLSGQWPETTQNRWHRWRRTYYKALIIITVLRWWSIRSVIPESDVF